jgi:hypothetical protein
MELEELTSRSRTKHPKDCSMLPKTFADVTYKLVNGQVTGIPSANVNFLMNMYIDRLSAKN